MTLNERKIMKFSIEQIQEMRHALGNKIKKNSHRNYFNTGTNSESWDELVCMGLAIKSTRAKELGGVYYHVTDKGIEVLRSLLYC
jgi:hypothetical protein